MACIRCGCSYLEQEAAVQGLVSEVVAPAVLEPHHQGQHILKGGEGERDRGE